MADGFIVRKGGVGGELTPPTPSVFLNATGGTTLEYDLDSKRYRSHTFTSNGTFEVTQLSNLEDFNNVDYLVIAGGGSTNGTARGAGGAGGYRTTNGISGGNSSPEPKVTVTATTYSVTVGAGGGSNANGANSSIDFPNSIISIGGGRGASEGSNGVAGGSGGGAHSNQFNRTGGAGTAGQGFKGGNSIGGTGNNVSGGGGGAGSVGKNGIRFGANERLFGGVGGSGLFNSLRTGVPEPRGGGGQGFSFGIIGVRESTDLDIEGKVFGGGFSVLTHFQNTQQQPPQIFSPAVINTGGGGGGNFFNNGASGIVVIRYEIATV